MGKSQYEKKYKTCYQKELNINLKIYNKENNNKICKFK